MTDSQPILIIGAGVAGPVLALFLQRAGFSTEIFEATGSPAEAGGALGLAPNGMNVLAAAGIAEQVRDVSVNASEWVFENQSGKMLASSSAAGDAARYGQGGVLITRAALHLAVVAHAAAQGIPIHYNKRLVAVHDTPGEPIVTHFADGTRAEGKFVVGADGIHSQTRQAILPDAPKPVYTGMMAPGGFSPCIDAYVTPRSDQRVHFLFGRKGFFGYFNCVTASGPRTVWWSTASAPFQAAQERTATVQDGLRNRLLALHGDWGYPVPQLIQSATEILNISIHDVPSLPRWSTGRTILIGDAAHAVAPHSGQGASMALEDAQLLAKLLSCPNDSGLDSIFARFECERRPRTNKVIELGRRNAQRKEVMSPAAYWMQQQMIRIFVPLTHTNRQDWLLAYKVE